MPLIKKCSAISGYRERKNNVISLTYNIPFVKNDLGLIAQVQFGNPKQGSIFGTFGITHAPMV